MIGWILAVLAAGYGAALVREGRRTDASLRPYPSPDEAETELARLAERHPALCERSELGRSTEGRPVSLLRLHGAGPSTAATGLAAASTPRARLLVTAGIHAVELVGSYVARAVANALLEGYGREPDVTDLLDRADVFLVPHLNPDGAARIWRNGGRSSLSGARFTSNGVDPNRNFPFRAAPGRGGWNTGSARSGSPYYRGPRPLSEPECLALARLCRRERFCAAVNFHSFGGVVYLPSVLGGDTQKASSALAVFQGVFQQRQRHLRYRPVPERSAKIAGQLDPFLLNAFGTPSVTVEVSRPGVALLRPKRASRIFWWANPPDPERWAANDAPATVAALRELLARTGGQPCTPAQPELADAIGLSETGRATATDA